MGPFGRRLLWCCEGDGVGMSLVPALRGGKGSVGRHPRVALRFTLGYYRPLLTGEGCNADQRHRRETSRTPSQPDESLSRRVPWCCEDAAVGMGFVPALRGGMPRRLRQPRGALRFPWATIALSLREMKRNMDFPWATIALSLREMSATWTWNSDAEPPIDFVSRQKDVTLLARVPVVLCKGCGGDEFRPGPTGRDASAATATQGCAPLPLGYYRPLPTGDETQHGLPLGYYRPLPTGDECNVDWDAPGREQVKVAQGVAQRNPGNWASPYARSPRRVDRTIRPPLR